MMIELLNNNYNIYFNYLIICGDGHFAISYNYNNNNGFKEVIIFKKYFFNF